MPIPWEAASLTGPRRDIGMPSRANLSAGKRGRWHPFLPYPGRALDCGIPAECAVSRAYKPKADI